MFPGIAKAGRGIYPTVDQESADLSPQREAKLSGERR